MNTRVDQNLAEMALALSKSDPEPTLKRLTQISENLVSLIGEADGIENYLKREWGATFLPEGITYMPYEAYATLKQIMPPATITGPARGIAQRVLEIGRGYDVVGGVGVGGEDKVVLNRTYQLFVMSSRIRSNSPALRFDTKFSNTPRVLAEVAAWDEDVFWVLGALVCLLKD